jgi:hypothetical protein
MTRLTSIEEKRVVALCLKAWDHFLKEKGRMLSVSLNDIFLLMKAGAIRIMHGRVTDGWRVEVELYQHIFFYEDKHYFFVSGGRKRLPYP